MNEIELIYFAIVAVKMIRIKLLFSLLLHINVHIVWKNQTSFSWFLHCDFQNKTKMHCKGFMKKNIDIINCKDLFCTSVYEHHYNIFYIKIAIFLLFQLFDYWAVHSFKTMDRQCESFSRIFIMRVWYFLVHRIDY